MTIYELWETILGSGPEDWVHHELIPNRAKHWFSAAYVPDISVGLQWGATCEKDFKEDWHSKFPDPKASSEWVDLLFNGHTVDRTALVNVDGGRCYLPLPQGADRSTVIERDYRMARVVQSILYHNPADVDNHLKMAGIKPPSA
jgi:hypothetical protein